MFKFFLLFLLLFVPLLQTEDREIETVDMVVFKTVNLKTKSDFFGIKEHKIRSIIIMNKDDFNKWKIITTIPISMNQKFPLVTKRDRYHEFFFSDTTPVWVAGETYCTYKTINQRYKTPSIYSVEENDDKVD